MSSRFQQAERTAHESLAALRAMFEMNREGLVISAPGGKLIACNEAARCRMAL